MANNASSNGLADKEHILFVIRLLLDRHGNVLNGTLISERGEFEEAFRTLDEIPHAILGMLTARDS